MSKTGTKLACQIGVKYARLLHDFHWMKFKSRTATPGWAGLSSTPETVPLFMHPNNGGPKDDIRLTKEWEKFAERINPPEGFRFIMIPKSGWLNRNDAADTLGFGGNVVEVSATVKNFAQVKTFNVNEKPPDPATWNFETHPELVHKFTVITRMGNVINPANGIDSYNFLIGKSPLYVPFERLEFFPALPNKIKIKATSLPRVRTRETASVNGKVIGKFLPLESAVVEEYAPRGTSVWGKTERGWLALCWYLSAGNLRYFTSWAMKTIPAIPPHTVKA
jgi:hypothetical protein